MSLSPALKPHFNEQSVIRCEEKSNDGPKTFTMRLNAEQREKLKAAANGTPLGTYVRSVLFGNGGSMKPSKVKSLTDAEALAHALALLGQSRVQNNLDHAAKALKTGTHPVTPELCTDLTEACQHVAEIRLMLIKALGMRPRR
jgi:hypothetical protein